MRKVALTVTGIAAIFGVGVGMAAPASAQIVGFYKTKADCEAEINGRSGYSCFYNGASDDGGVSPWALDDGTHGPG